MEFFKPKKISFISLMHFGKLAYRSMLFICALMLFLVYKDNTDSKINGQHVLLIFGWISFMIEMLFRFFPNKAESMGCQKQFSRNYIKDETYTEKAKLDTKKGTILSAVSWIILNGIIGTLYYTKVISKDILVLISLFFSVCDMICILFFCPFQTFMMKNKCCTSCRIYNWDFFMMFTPLIFINSIWGYSLVFVSLVLLVKWEITVHRHPERFLESSNLNLRCENCQEKLCSHKTQLQVFLKEEYNKIKNLRK